MIPREKCYFKIIIFLLFFIVLIVDLLHKSIFIQKKQQQQQQQILMNGKNNLDNESLVRVFLVVIEKVFELYRLKCQSTEFTVLFYGID